MPARAILALPRNPRAGVDAVLARVAVDHLRAMVAVQWPYSRATEVFLDFHAPIRTIYDGFALADGVVLSYAKVESDSVSLSDVAIIEAAFLREPSDTLTLSDQFVALAVFFRDFADSTSPTDTAALDVGKEFLESVSPGEAIVLVVGFAFDDAVSASDTAPIFDFGMGKSDSVSPTEVLAQDLSKPTTDSVSPTESAALAVDKPASDSVTPSETSTLDIGLVKTDSATPTEVATQDLSKALQDTPGVTDSPALDFSTPFTDSVTPSDAPALSADKVLTESVAPADVSVLDVLLAPADSVAPSDGIDLLTTWVRDFNDGFTLDDASYAESWDLSKSNILTMEETTAFVFTMPALADSVSPSDAAALSTDLVPSDTMSVPDTVAADFSQAPPGETVTMGDGSIVLDLVPGGSAPSAILNAATLNAPTLNQ